MTLLAASSKAQDLTSLTQKDKQELSTYIKGCELTKKNSQTYKSAYETCVSRETDVSSTVLLTEVGLLSLIVGFLVGAGTRGN